MARRPLKDVVVLLPGITGSVLRKDGKDLWAFSGGAITRALLSLGGSIKALALEEDPPDVDDLGDGITADRVAPDVHMFPGLWKIDGYSKVANWIRQQFDARPGENFFEFPYDWRRDNRVAARKLGRAARGWLAAWRERSGAADARLVLVGHSMGGLVSRHFLECLEGWRDTRMLITFGTPYRGSPSALGFVANGLRKKLGPLTLVDLSDLLRSLTSVYQLLPIYPCYDAGDGKPVRVTEATIPNLDAGKGAAALAFHLEIADAVEAHERDEDYRRGGYRVCPVVGTFQPTSQSARRSAGGVEILQQYFGDDAGGDGTVPRVSATPIEMQQETGAMFVSERHASLQNSDPVLVQLSGWLSGSGIDLSAFRAFPGSNLALDLEDAFVTGEPVTVRVRPEDEAVGELTAIVADAERGGEVDRATLRDAGGGWRRAELTPLPEGTYRITVRGGMEARPVSDVFAVFPGA